MLAVRPLFSEQGANMAKREEEYKRLELFYQLLVHYLDRPYSDVELGDLLGTDRSNV